MMDVEYCALYPDLYATIMNQENEDLKKAYEQALADVVIKLNKIEVLLELILLGIIQPNVDNYSFIRTTLFNTSFLSFNSKFKLVENIFEQKGWKKKDLKPIHILMNIRNTFAHSNLIFVTSSTKDENSVLTTKTLKLNQQQSGVVEKQNYLELHEKFNEAYTKIYDCLNAAAIESRKIWEPNVVVKVTKI
jgi:hypothetical protein